MTLRKKTKIVQSKNANTQYIVIPSALVADSQYPFRNGDEIEIIVDPIEKRIIIVPVES